MELDDGRFVIEEEIGRGTFARVYRAMDTKRNRACAVKVLSDRAVKETRKRFVAEIKALLRLRHPHILRVYSAGAVGGRGYVVTALANHGSLLDRVRESGTLPVDDVLEWMIQTCSALATAHAAGVIHRDVKPSNIMLDHHDRAVLGDFGIAMQVSDEAQRLTRTGTSLGTTIYMAPEQRQDAKRVGPEADLYSVASSIYRMVTGLNPQDIYAVSEESERWQRIPLHLRPMMRKATQLDPHLRYRTGGEMAAALLELLPDHRKADVLAQEACRPESFPEPWSALPQEGATLPPELPSEPAPRYEPGEAAKPPEASPTPEPSAAAPLAGARPPQVPTIEPRNAPPQVPPEWKPDPAPTGPSTATIALLVGALAAVVVAAFLLFYQ